MPTLERPTGFVLLVALAIVLKTGFADAETVTERPPTRSLREAVEATPAGGPVLLEPGRYVAGRGGLGTIDGDLVIRSTSGPGSTVIEQGPEGPALSFHREMTGKILIEGVTVLGSSASSAAVHIDSPEGSITFRNCLFRGDAGAISAGALDIERGAPRFLDCDFERMATERSIVVVSGGTPLFEDCRIRENRSLQPGIVLGGGQPVFRRAEVSANSGGPAVRIETASTFEECRVIGNAGPGVVISDGIVDFSECRISGNAGGGLVVGYGPSSFRSCVISENHGAGVSIKSLQGAGLARASSSTTDSGGLEFIDCLIQCNVNTSANGGGLRFDCFNVPTGVFEPLFLRCTISGNQSLFDGGGVMVCGIAVFTDIAPVFQNCTITGNEAGGRGGGLLLAVDSLGGNHQGDVLLAGSICWGNSAGQGGDEIFVEDGNTLTADCSILKFSGVSGPGNAFYDGYTISANPRFCDPTGACGEEDYQVQAGSPAAAANSACGQLIGAWDVGCSKPDPQPDPRVEFAMQVAPNPFPVSAASGVRIRFETDPSDGPVSLRIFDIRGRTVRRLLDDSVLGGGLQQVSWTGKDDRGSRVAPGAYFVRLVVGTRTSAKRVILLNR